MTEINELRDRIQFLETLAGYTTNTARSPVCENLKWYHALIPRLGKKNDGSIFFHPLEEDCDPRASEVL